MIYFCLAGMTGDCAGLPAKFFPDPFANFSPCVATLQLGRYLFDVIFVCGIYLRALAFFLTYDTFFSPSVWTSARCANLPPIHLVWLSPVFSSSANFLTAQAYPKTRPVCLCTRYKLFNECYFFQHYYRLYSTNSWASAIFIPTMIFLNLWQGQLCLLH